MAKNPMEHLSAATASAVPTSSVELDSEMYALLEQCVLNEPGMTSLQSDAEAFWIANKARWASWQKAAIDMYSPQQRDVVGKLSLFVLSDMLTVQGNLDMRLIEDLDGGFPVTGELSLGGLGNHVEGGVRTTAPVRPQRVEQFGPILFYPRPRPFLWGPVGDPLE